VVSIRDQIRAADDLSAELVDIDEWAVTVEVRSMTGRQRAAVVRAISGDDDDRLESLWGEILVACVHDPDSGEPVFDADDLEWLFDKSAAVIDRLSTVCLRVAGIVDGAVDEAGKDSSASLTLVDG